MKIRHLRIVQTKCKQDVQIALLTRPFFCFISGEKTQKTCQIAHSSIILGEQAMT